MAVQDQIAELLQLPASGADAPTLGRLEDTLTEGYARALALEGERLRLERRLGEVARDAGEGEGGGLAEELASLSERLTVADRELARLRALLRSLQERARAVRRRTAR
jgi:hypothetical protein